MKTIKNFDLKKVSDIMILGYSLDAYAEYDDCDYYIESALYDGEDMTEDQIEELEEMYPELIAELINEERRLKRGL